MGIPDNGYFCRRICKTKPETAAIVFFFRHFLQEKDTVFKNSFLRKGNVRQVCGKSQTALQRLMTDASATIFVAILTGAGQ